MMTHIEGQLGFIWDGEKLYVRLLCGLNDQPSKTWEHHKKMNRERSRRFRAKKKLLHSKNTLALKTA